MVGIYSVEAQELVNYAAEALKDVDQIQPPEWANYVKTGHFKKRQPASEDWWYFRTAAILRSIYKLGPIGTQKLRTKYGGKKDRGHKTEHFYKGSGSVIRKALQQLEAAGLIEKGERGVHKGRICTGKGVSFLNAAAKKINQERAKEEKAPTQHIQPSKPAPKAAPKPEAKPAKEEAKKESAPKADAKPEAKEAKPEAKEEVKEDKKE